LSQAEKQTVKQVAQHVSADLGIKLLAPTPGARGLIKTLSKDKEEEEARKLAMLTAGDNAGEFSSVAKASTAKDLLKEHKRKVLIEKQVSAPKLGRGFGDGFIDLNGPTGKPSVDLAKAKALLALKGKSIASKSPNYVPGKKRKADEVENSRKRVAKALSDSKLAEEKRLRGDGDEEQELVSSSGRRMSKERLEAICKARSRNEHLVDQMEEEMREKALDNLEKKEAMEEKMLNTKELETKAVTCHQCKYTAFTQSDLCKEAGHRVKVVKTTKKFFSCADCGERTFCLDKYPKHPCKKCGGSRFARAGMMREKKVKAEGEKLLVRGLEQKFINQTVSSDDLIL